MTTLNAIGTPQLTTNGQLIIGHTSNSPAVGTLTAGQGITVTNGAGSITIASNGASTPYTVETGATNLVAYNRYAANSGSLITFTLPSTAAVGDYYEIQGYGAGLFAVAQNASQAIYCISQFTTTGTGGSLTAVEQYNSIKITCVIANTYFVVNYLTGDFTIV